MRLTAFTAPETSSPPPLERSPLEPLRPFSRQLNKQQTDNAKWEGQKRALRLLDKKKTRITPQSTDPRLNP